MISVIGAGRVGSVFLRCAEKSAIPAVAVGRTGVVAEQGMVVVCTRMDALPTIQERKIEPERLVFVQNGIVTAPGSTLGILYFAAPKPDGQAEPGGDSLFCGPLATLVVQLLTENGIPARVIEDPQEFRAEQGIKLGWSCALGLLGERYGEKVGQSMLRPELEDLATEWAPLFQAALQAPVTATQLVDRWRSYSARIPGWQASVRELPWRNGYLLEQAARLGFSTPLHRKLLTALQRPDVDALLR